MTMMTTRTTIVTARRLQAGDHIKVRGEWTTLVDITADEDGRLLLVTTADGALSLPHFADPWELYPRRQTQGPVVRDV